MQCNVPLQGALDGGLNVPHSEKRFVGYNRDDKSLDADTLRKFIYGGAVADYMNEMEVRCWCAPGDKSLQHSLP